MNVIYVERFASEDRCGECDCLMAISLTDDGTEVVVECDCGSAYLVA